MTFNITSTDNKMLVRGILGYELNLYLTGYKSK